MKKIKSESGKINKTEIIKVAKGIGIAFSGAALVIMGQFLAGMPASEMYLPIFTAISAVLINIGRKLYDGKTVTTV
jgi:hypothetical protein